MAELRKQIEEERQVEELRQLHAASGGSKRAQRLDWMYEGPAAAAREEENDAYLLGKAFKDTSQSEVKQVRGRGYARAGGHALAMVRFTSARFGTLTGVRQMQSSSTPGALWLEQEAPVAADLFRKLHDDPMFAIKCAPLRLLRRFAGTDRAAAVQGGGAAAAAEAAGQPAQAA